MVAGQFAEFVQPGRASANWVGDRYELSPLSRAVLLERLLEDKECNLPSPIRTRSGRRRSEVLALMREADVLFTASLADGMNLVPLQTAIAQTSRPQPQRGIILVGRDAGVASAYADFAEDGLVPFDPLDAEDTARALDEALHGRPGRISDRLIRAIRERDAPAWGLSFLAALTER